MKTLILINILSSNNVYRLNSYIDASEKKLGRTHVFFCGETERNRRWSLHEKIGFTYKILPNMKIEIGSKDLFTYFINYSIWNELDKLKPDRIIVCGWYQFSYQIAYLWALVNKRKITLWSESTINEKSVGRTLTMPLVKLLVKMSDDFIACGKRSKEYLMHLGADKRKITIFLEDVNKDYFVRESRKWSQRRLQTKKALKITTKYNFIYVGQLIQRKGVTNLLKAFGNFKDNNSDWGLVIVGYGDQEKLLRQTVRNKGIKDVFFLGGC